jgi:hypothetical protein
MNESCYGNKYKEQGKQLYHVSSSGATSYKAVTESDHMNLDFSTYFVCFKFVGFNFRVPHRRHVFQSFNHIKCSGVFMLHICKKNPDA